MNTLAARHRLDGIPLNIPSTKVLFAVSEQFLTDVFEVRHSFSVAVFVLGNRTFSNFAS